MESSLQQEATSGPHMYESLLMEGEADGVSGDVSEQTETTESIGEDLTEMETETGLQLAEDAASQSLTSPQATSSFTVNSSLPLSTGPIRARVHKRTYIRVMKEEATEEAVVQPEGEDEDEVELPDPADAEARETAQLAIGKRSSGERPFQLQWLYQFKWLRYDEENNRMFCDYCTEAKRKNAFGKERGTNNFRKSNCEEHQRSREHRLAQEQLATLRKSRPSSALDDSVEEVVRGYYQPRNVHIASQKGKAIVSPQKAGGQVAAPAENISQANLEFHAKKAHMLLSGFMCQKNLPTTLAKELLDIMPFMFPDSKIASAIPKMEF
ncbi:hypothetical protein RvY_16118 [Ramazzottius varieornatus]|uniref:TTF-type domain-containing protein n=1 Tax=Ramazzottius varieornatus TaxID=947166 RepID=A0A1D1W0A9_RAMVA|nr:hypothetical protein RvY_16118 [Ramazzottius varieornatus]